MDEVDLNDLPRGHSSAFEGSQDNDDYLIENKNTTLHPFAHQVGDINMAAALYHNKLLSIFNNHHRSLSNLPTHPIMIMIISGWWPYTIINIR